MQMVVNRHNSLLSSSSLSSFSDNTSPQTRVTGYQHQSAYMQDSQYHHLQEHYESLELQVVGLTAERDALKAICQQFSGPSQPQHGHSHIDMPIDPLLLSLPQDDMKQPTPETHPNVKFWK
ncbi:hypothetical protein PAXRUDRAFT_14098 [Paxillus rubicundulus Ve08.2h10]|uniref:Uncharacterized protein n=1 Tax=Paxillus rubicundulus Ve08.2h10 TaxID=930991 RepID=A0A0D0DIM0_9AGAM|nr:hypothetical protein PAXRUDRAFT_14098 [Paxillus rubicundulus Ve08.2h10]